MSFWSLPCHAVDLPELQLRYLLLDIAGLKITVGMSSVLTGILNRCIFQSGWRFVQLSLRLGA